MAVFNPDNSQTPSANMPNDTYASRGSIPDRSAASILEGVGTAASGAVNAYNDYNHFVINQTVQTGYDQANKDINDALPTDLTKAPSSIAALQTAYEQGKISDVYYTGQLATMTKNLRAQYPQFDDYIDRTVRSVTGIHPANAFRNALQASFAQQQQSQNDQIKWQQNYEKENEGIISKLFPDYWQNKDKYSFDFVQSAVANDKAQTNYITNQNLQMDYLEKNNKLTQDQAEQTAAASLGYTVSSSMTGAANGMGISGDNLFKKIQDMHGQGFTGQEYTQVMGQLGSWQTSVKMQLTQQMYRKLNPADPNSKSMFEILGPESAQKQIDAAMQPINDIVSYATNNEWGLATYYLNQNKVNGDRALNTVLNASPELQTANALAKVDPALAEQWIAQSGNQQGVLTEITPEVVARVAQGQDTFGGAVARMASSSYSDVEKAGGINALIDSNKATITSGKASPDQFANAVNGTYAPDQNGADIFTYIKPDEYNDLYTKMYSKDVTDSIVKSGDKDLLKTYYNSAVAHIFSTPEFTQAAKAIQDTQTLSRGATVAFDPQSGQLVVNIDPNKLDPLGNENLHIPDFLRNDYIKKGRDAVQTLNSMFSTLSPMLDGLGSNPQQKEEAYQAIVQKLSVDLTAGKTQGFFDWLLSGFKNNQEGASKDQKTSDATPARTSLDFNLPQNSTASPDYMNKVASVESGGYPNAANPNSSATGTYQILDSTYNRYAGVLGLNGSKNDQANQQAVMDAYTNDSVHTLQGNKLPVTDANLYAMHFLGQTDGAHVLSAPDDAQLSDYLSPRVIAANKFLQGMTVGDFKKWTETKMS